MHYSGICKLLALVLSAALLCTALASGMAVFSLNEAGLYQHSFEDAYNARRDEILQSTAEGIALRYAAMELGGMAQQMVEEYYGTSWYLEQFSFGKMGYTLRDEGGTDLLTHDQTGTWPQSETISVSVGVQTYPKVERKLSLAQWQAMNQPYEKAEQTNFYDAVPPEGAVVTRITATYGDSSDAVESTGGLGRIFHNGEGFVEFRGDVADILDVSRRRELTAICFENEELGVLCEIMDPEGPGLLYARQDGKPIFQSNERSGDVAAKPRPVENGTSGEIPEYDWVIHFYDPQTHEETVALCTAEESPAYTVEFRLAPGALEGDPVWQILGLVFSFRERLVPVLIGSIVLFGLLMVYLCWAAGRRPGRDLVCAGGLNRLPIEIWLLLWLVFVMVAMALGSEGVPYLMEGSLELGVLLAAGLTYGCCLVTVCLCFACAAQFNSREGFWWRNSLAGRCLLILWRMGKALLPLAKRLWNGLWKLALALALLLRGWLRDGFRLGKKWWKACTDGILRFLNLLPVSWQWLLGGFGIVLVLSLTAHTPLSIWGICGCLALVLYGAHAFGTLLEGAKRMNRGNLEETVEDRLLVGSFREFAGELNSIADVVNTAAQKQLKSERMKTELITNVSHDIKTPLTSIINYVDLLEKPHTPQEQQVYLEVLSRQSQALKKLIEDLMEMSKASTGNMAVDIQRVDAVEAVNQALGEFGDKLDRAGLIPVFRHSRERMEILADGRLLWRVLSNLLSNAVKYAQSGTRLYLDVTQMEEVVILSLKNISREELNVSAEELMERFVRGDASRNTEGSGLGLNIAQSLMQLQKGELQLLVDGDLFKVTLTFPAA